MVISLFTIILISLPQSSCIFIFTSFLKPFIYITDAFIIYTHEYYTAFKIRLSKKIAFILTD